MLQKTFTIQSGSVVKTRGSATKQINIKVQEDVAPGFVGLFHDLTFPSPSEDACAAVENLDGYHLVATYTLEKLPAPTSASAGGTAAS